MKTVLDKKNLRKYALGVRQELAYNGMTQNKSAHILGVILNSDDFKSAKNVALYLPIKNEIDITALLKIKDKNFYLPRCNQNELEFVRYLGEDYLTVGAFDIKEPLGEAINPEILDIIYIPALMANKKGYRLGYGKGFYDRFFKKYNLKAKKIIVLAQELILDDFVQDDFDYKCDLIISA